MKADRWIVAWVHDPEPGITEIQTQTLDTREAAEAEAAARTVGDGWRAAAPASVTHVVVEAPDPEPQPGEVWVSNHGHGQPLVVAGMVDGIVVGRWQLGSGPGHPCAWTLDEFRRFCARKAAS